MSGGASTAKKLREPVARVRNKAKATAAAGASGATAAPSQPAAVPEPRAVDKVDTSYLESLLGYNARRAALAVIEVFLQRMAVYDLRPVDFSVLSLITHNPGITSRQLCTTLGVLPPNLVGMVNSLEKRGLIARAPHPHDRRAMGLHLTAAGEDLMREAERTAAELETDVGSRLTPAELKTLMRLLKKIYL